jgi:hypothetical protein
MSSTYLELTLRANGREVFTTAEAPSARTEAERTLKCGQNNVNKTLSPSTTPAIEKSPISRTITLAGSPVSIDLTAAAVLALPAAATRTVDMAGKKLVAIIARGDDDNTDPITIAEGTNGYPVFGAGVVLPVLPGETVVKYFSTIASGHPAVSGGVNDEIEIDGTSGDILYLDLFFGT